MMVQRWVRANGQEVVVGGRGWSTRKPSTNTPSSRQVSNMCPCPDELKGSKVYGKNILPTFNSTSETAKRTQVPLKQWKTWVLLCDQKNLSGYNKASSWFYVIMLEKWSIRRRIECKKWMTFMVFFQSTLCYSSFYMMWYFINWWFPWVFWYTMKVSQSCLTLCDPMVCSPQGSSVHEILQARILEGVAISYSRGSFQPRDQTSISCVFCTGRQTFYRYRHLGSLGQSLEERKGILEVTTHLTLAWIVQLPAVSGETWWVLWSRLWSRDLCAQGVELAWWWGSWGCCSNRMKFRLRTGWEGVGTVLRRPEPSSDTLF